MGIVQDYLNRTKRTYQPVWVVKSTREGVLLPVERQVDEIKPIKRTRYGDDGQVVEHGECFCLDGVGFPYEVDMWNRESSGSEDGCGSGIGDLWVWTYATFKYKFSALRYYKKESSRINKKYIG
jgi:hypothetical protein